LNTDLPKRSRITILIKAAPRIGETHGELVCCAGVDDKGQWVRLYPVSFKSLEDSQKFGRWDIIEYDWRLPKGDARRESRRVEHRSLRIVGALADKFRQEFVARLVTESLDAELTANRSLALIRPVNPVFITEKKSDTEIEKAQELARRWHEHDNAGLFGSTDKSFVPRKVAPYTFKYRYEIKDGKREGTCQDWEIEATFWKWRKKYGEQDTLSKMKVRFGEEYPNAGFVLAMGTHKAYPSQWLINGVVRLNHGSEEEVRPLLL
jgi:hypothetical protein